MQKFPRKKKQKWISATEGLVLQKLGSELDEHKYEDHDNHTHSHSQLEYDPHIWQSPSLTKQAVQKIAATLKDILPEEENKIESCTQSYIQKIDYEVNSLKKEIESIPKENRIIATNHDALGYFADEFGFQIFSIVGLSDESSPTPVQLKKLSKILRKKMFLLFFLNQLEICVISKPFLKKRELKLAVRYIVIP